MNNRKFVIQPHFRLQEWVAEEKGYFSDEGLDYRRDRPIQRRQGPRYPGAQVRRLSDLRGGAGLGRQMRLPLDGQGGRANGHGKLWADAYSVSPGRVRAAGLAVEGA